MVLQTSDRQFQSRQLYSKSVKLGYVSCFTMFHRPKSPLLGAAVAPSNSGSAGDTERGASAMGPYQRGQGRCSIFTC